MYNPYDQYSDRRPNVSIGAIMAGTGFAAAGLAVPIFGSGAMRKFEENVYNKNAHIRGWWNRKYGGFTGPRSQHMFKNTAFRNAGNPIKSQWKGFKEDLRIYAPWTKHQLMGGNKFIGGLNSEVQRTIWGRNLGPDYKYTRIPILGKVFAASMMRQEFETGNPNSALLVGGVREAGGLVGMRTGIAAMSRFGFMGGSKLLALGGAGIGAIAGAAIGYMLPDAAKWIKNTGRRISMPELGGKFYDSQEAQTLRQRSLNAIRTSQFNVRSELGNEAYRLVTGY